MSVANELAWYINFISANILKLYDVLARHFEKYPDDRQRFHNFESRPFIARGPQGPLEGDLHSAQYFHGRHVYSIYVITNVPPYIKSNLL